MLSQLLDVIGARSPTNDHAAALDSKAYIKQPPAQHVCYVPRGCYKLI